jgi:hypothetical protein
MDITSANAVLLLTVPQVLTVATQLQGFAADDIYDFEDREVAEAVMGADGVLSGGIIYKSAVQTITFQADSASIAVMDAWTQAQRAAIAVFPGFMNVTLTSIGKSYTCGPGILTRVTPVAAGKRILQPQKYRIEWGNVIPTPVGVAG